MFKFVSVQAALGSWMYVLCVPRPPERRKRNTIQQGVGLCIVGCSDLPPRPLTHYLPHHTSHHCFPSLYHHYSPSYAPSYALTKKSIKGNPFLHYQVFHQKNPSKEIHFCTIIFSIKKIHQRKTIICTIKFSITSSSFFSINFFITTKGIFNGR